MVLFDQDFRFEFFNIQEPGEILIELMHSTSGSEGSTVAGRHVIKSNELHSLLRQEVGWSSAKCVYSLSSTSNSGQEAQVSSGSASAGVTGEFSISVAFSRVPHRSRRQDEVFELNSSVLPRHASWGGIRTLEALGSRFVRTGPRVGSPCWAKGVWRKHLLFRSGKVVVGLPAKSDACKNKIVVMTIIAVKHLPQSLCQCGDSDSPKKISCLVTAPDAKQVKC